MARMAAEETQLVTLKVPLSMLENLEDFRFRHRFANRSDAMRFLWQKALEAGFEPTSEDGTVTRRSA